MVAADEELRKTMITEKHIHIASKLLKMRDTCRRFYKEEWPEKQRQWMPYIQAAMKKHNCDELDAAITMSKQIEGEDFSIMVIFGVAMEMMDSKPNNTK